MGPLLSKTYRPGTRITFSIFGFRLQILDHRFSPPDHGDVAPETVGHCAAVMNDDGVLLELLPEEFERSWDSLAEEGPPGSWPVSTIHR